MLTEEIIPFDRIEVLADGTIQVREARVIMRDGVRDESIPASYNRYVLVPGSDVSKRHERIAMVASAVWTDAVVASWTNKSASLLA